MPFEIKPAGLEDVPWIVETMAAVPQNDISRLRIGSAAPEDVRDWRSEDFAHMVAVAQGRVTQGLPPQEVLLLVVDTESGKAAAFAQWILPPPESGPGSEEAENDPAWAPHPLRGLNRELHDETVRSCVGAKAKALGVRKRFCLLHQLYTHPDYQRKGLAGMLISWPLAKADRERLPCVLITSVRGHTVSLYEKYGFRVKEVCGIDLKPHGGDKVWEYAALVREPNAGAPPVAAPIGSTSDKLRVGIIIVSDTAAKDPSTDKSGMMLRELFETDAESRWDVASVDIVPDEVAQIQEKVKIGCDLIGLDGRPRCNLVITSGGTGFAIRDYTPEAIEPLLERKAPGLVHTMLSTSLQITPFAAMARPLACTRKKTIIITLPGSPKGAKENLQAILKLLPHACLQAAGEDSRLSHAGGVKKLEKEAGVSAGSAGADVPTHGNHSHHSHDHHHHHHHHGPGGHQAPQAHTKPSERPMSNNPSAGPSQRYRESPYPMITVKDALKKVLHHAPSPTVLEKSVNTSLVGYILAEDVTALAPVPAFRASIVDGYAVSTPSSGTNKKGTFPVASVSHAAPGTIPPLEPGTVVRITTGAPLPPYASAVVMVEDTVLKRLSADGQEEAEVEILTDQVNDGENVREVGSDISTGEVILKQGDEITAVGGELGLLAAVGRSKVRVYRKPIVGVLSTGNEIVPHDREDDLRLGEVRDTNRITLMSAISGWGYEVLDLGIVHDAPDDLESALRHAIQRADVTVTSGGVSMGELDLLKPTIERALGGTVQFGRLSMKPGKPTTFATMPYKATNGDPATALIFSLPGNPASAVVTAALFVRPCLDKISGKHEERLGMPTVKVALSAAVGQDAKREEYQRATVWQGDDGRLYGSVTGGQRSSRIGSFKAANALLVVPAGAGELSKGEIVDALLLGGLGH